MRKISKGQYQVLIFVKEVVVDGFAGIDRFSRKGNGLAHDIAYPVILHQRRDVGRLAVHFQVPEGGLVYYRSFKGIMNRYCP